MRKNIKVGVNFNVSSLTKELAKINKTVEMLQSMTQRSNRTIEQIRVSVPSTPNEIRDEALGAKLAADNLVKLVDGLGKGINEATSFVKGFLSKTMDLVSNSFKQALDDQTSDIQAIGGLYGAFIEKGLTKSYEQAKEVSKIIETEVANVVKDSVAPTELVTFYSRSLTDNVGSALIKAAMKNKGVGLETAAQMVTPQLAKLYEKLALLTPKAYSPAMVSSAMEQALQGASFKKLRQYKFFENSPIILSTMEQLGFFATKDFDKKLSILEKALETALPDETLRELRGTLSGGIQGLTDTLHNATVGVLSVAKEFQVQTDVGDAAMFNRTMRYVPKEDKAMFAKLATNPIKMISFYLAPFLQDLSVLFSKAGTVMGWISQAWLQNVAPIFLTLTQFLEGINKESTSFPAKLGKLWAKIISVFSGTNVNVGSIRVSIDEFRKEFLAGWNSLKFSIKLEDLVAQARGSIVSFLHSGLLKVLGIIFSFFIAKSVIEVALSIFTQLAILSLGSLFKWVIKALIPKVILLLVQGIGIVISPIGLTVAALVALVAVATVAIVRYRDELWNLVQGISQAVAGLIQITSAGLLAIGTILATPFLVAFELFQRSMQALGIMDKNKEVFNSIETIKGGLSTSANLAQTGATNVSQGTTKTLEAGNNLISQVKNDFSSAVNGLNGLITKMTGTNNQTVDNAGAMSNSTANAAEAGLTLANTTHSLSTVMSQSVASAGGLGSSIKAAWSSTTSAINILKSAIQSIQMFSGGGSVGSVDLSGDMMGRAKQMFLKLKEMGFGRVGAAMLTGTMLQESNINPNAIQPGGLGYGILQWDGARRDHLKQTYGSAWNDVGNQLSYLAGELNGNITANGNYKKWGDILKSTDSFEEARRAEKGYIGWGHEGSRYSYAKKILEQSWAKWKGFQPASTPSLLNAATKTQAFLRSRAKTRQVSYSAKVDRLNVNDIQHYEALGEKVSYGVVMAFDRALDNASLYSIGV